MYDGNSLAIDWQDIRDLGYRDWEDCLQSLEKEEDEQDY